MTVKQELKVFFEQAKVRSCRIALLPDFFLDRFIDLQWNPQDFSQLLIDKVNRKGGSIDGIAQTDIQGGNAINVASALAHLGASVIPIVCTSKYGLQQIKYHLSDLSVDFSRVKIRASASITTALEFNTGSGGKTNVMIRDLGSLAHFGPNDLEEGDYAIIDSADYTCLFNWAGTLNFGTSLAQAVFSRAKKGKSKTYYDTADPLPNRGAITKLMENVLKSGQIDILSVNENEAITFAALFDPSLSQKNGELTFSQLAMESARVLASHLTARIDLHTTLFSATFRGKSETVAKTFKVKVLRATGAGDAWTAGNILGDWNNLSDESRLTLANAVSAYYLSDPEGKHPSWSKLSEFVDHALT